MVPLDNTLCGPPWRTLVPIELTACVNGDMDIPTFKSNFLSYWFLASIFLLQPGKGNALTQLNAETTPISPLIARQFHLKIEKAAHGRLFQYWRV